MWPTGLPAIGVPLKGRIPPAEQAAAGRALGRLTDIGWGNRLRPLLSPGAPDGELPGDVLDAVVTVLADWARGPGGWASGGPGAVARPAGVVAVGSRARPRLVRSLGEHVAAVGRLPFLGTVEPAVAEPPIRSNSARRVRALHESLRLPPGLDDAVRTAPGPLLLVDDYTDTGWTLAIAARLLRTAGAGEVLPLVLAIQG
jgi:ATP-dependent DNA helicase RecQ